METVHVPQGYGSSHGEAHQNKSVQSKLPDYLIDIGGHLVVGISAYRRIRPAKTSQISVTEFPIYSQAMKFAAMSPESFARESGCNEEEHSWQ